MPKHPTIAIYDVNVAGKVRAVCQLHERLLLMILVCSGPERLVRAEEIPG
jgi:hypothetical protein